MSAVIRVQGYDPNSKRLRVRAGCKRMRITSIPAEGRKPGKGRQRRRHVA